MIADKDTIVISRIQYCFTQEDLDLLEKNGIDNSTLGLMRWAELAITQGLEKLEADGV